MLTFHGNKSENTIALTFDDGPNPYGTPKVLDILAGYGVKANFFVIGKHARTHRAVLNRIKGEGHLIGLHGYLHERFRNDTPKASVVLERMLGSQPPYVRPPYGNVFLYWPEIFSKKNFLVLGNVAAFDWGRPADELYRTVVTHVRNGSIVIFHDGSRKDEESKRCEQTITALPRIIENLQKNYQLVRLDQMELQPINPFTLSAEAIGYGMRELRFKIHQDAL